MARRTRLPRVVSLAPHDWDEFFDLEAFEIDNAIDAIPLYELAGEGVYHIASFPERSET